jgi:hypothetical protein
MGGGKSSVVRAKAPVQCVGHQARKLRATHMKQRLVIAGFHIPLPWLRVRSTIVQIHKGQLD